jgi:hypothetical protein
VEFSGTYNARRDNLDPKNLKALYDILDDRERPYYEHHIEDRLAA